MDDDDEDDKVLRKDGVVRVPLMMMDCIQKAIFQDGVSNMSKKDAAIKATKDAMAKNARSEASQHRPGYRLSVKMTRDSAARDALQDVYDAYEADLCNRHKTASPEPIATRAAPTLDTEEFDSDAREEAYRQYDARLRDAWKNE